MIELKVVSPQKVIFQKEVEMAVLPGAEGDFAAMQNHSPFISSLRPGQMAIMSNNKTEESFFGNFFRNFFQKFFLETSFLNFFL